jgi:hypothetical protein
MIQAGEGVDTSPKRQRGFFSFFSQFRNHSLTLFDVALSSDNAVLLCGRVERQRGEGK